MGRSDAFRVVHRVDLASSAVHDRPVRSALCERCGVGRSAVGAVDTVEAEVRELVRRRGIDPVTDRAAMRRLVDEAVTE